MASITNLQVRLRIKSPHATGVRIATQLVRLATFVLKGQSGIEVEVE